MIPDPTKQDEIHSKLLNFNESLGTFGISIAIRSREKDPLGKKVQSFQKYIIHCKNRVNVSIFKVIC